MDDPRQPDSDAGNLDAEPAAPDAGESRSDDAAPVASQTVQRNADAEGFEPQAKASGSGDR